MFTPEKVSKDCYYYWIQFKQLQVTQAALEGQTSHPWMVDLPQKGYVQNALFRNAYAHPDNRPPNPAITDAPGLYIPMLTNPPAAILESNGRVRFYLQYKETQAEAISRIDAFFSKTVMKAKLLFQTYLVYVDLRKNPAASPTPIGYIPWSVTIDSSGGKLNAQVSGMKFQTGHDPKVWTP